MSAPTQQWLQYTHTSSTWRTVQRQAAVPPAALRVAAMCAAIGSVVSVAAGMTFGNVTNEEGTEHVLRMIAAQPSWYWPTVHLAFISGALLWVGAFVIVATSFERGSSRVLGWLGVVTIVIGAAVHIVDSSISGVGLSTLVACR